MNGARAIEIRARNRVRSLVFLEDGKHFLSADDEGVIRQWRCDDGGEIGEGIRTSGGLITAMALSGDGHWLVISGWQTASVLNRKSLPVAAFAVSEHTDWVDTIHVSPDSMKFATGANDKKAFIWDIATGKQLVGPLEHDDRVRTVRFSPTGDRIATTSMKCLRIYNANGGDLLNTITFSVAIPYASRHVIVWSGVQNVFAFTSQNIVAHIHVNAKQILSSWTIPGEQGGGFGYIALSSNGKFIASFIGRSISLWDVLTYTRIGSAIQHSVPIWSIALSFDNSYLATSDANGIITIRNLTHIVPSYYLVCQGAVQRPRNGSGAQLQAEAPHGELCAPDVHFDISRTLIKPPSDRLQAQSIPPRVSDGTYRIKSVTGDLYLAYQQGTRSTVTLQKSDPSSVLQRWVVSLDADGTYSIKTRRGNLDVSLGVGNANTLTCIPDGEYTAWVIVPRGDAYVIGNAGGATAIHRMQNHQTVSVSLCDNTQNQRWVLEPVID